MAYEETIRPPRGTTSTACSKKQINIIEPRHEKTNVLVSDLVRHKPDCTVELGFKKKSDYTIYVAKTKALISFAVIAKLICVFVFAYAKGWFSHDAAH